MNKESKIFSINKTFDKKEYNKKIEMKLSYVVAQLRSFDTEFDLPVFFNHTLITPSPIKHNDLNIKFPSNMNTFSPKELSVLETLVKMLKQSRLKSKNH